MLFARAVGLARGVQAITISGSITYTPPPPPLPRTIFYCAMNEDWVVSVVPRKRRADRPPMDVIRPVDDWGLKYGRINLRVRIRFPVLICRGSFTYVDVANLLSFTHISVYFRHMVYYYYFYFYHPKY